MEAKLGSIRTYAVKIYRRFRPAEAPAPVAEIVPPAAPAVLEPSADEKKLQYAKGVFTNGALPSNFTFTLGVAPCNYSCQFCPQSISKPKKAKWLDLGLLRKCLSEMPEDKVTLNVSSFSETIAAPNLVASIRLMKEVRPRLTIAMATNGSLFRENVISDLIDAGLDHYSYSFDAATPDAYRELIQVDNFDKAWRNLEQIVALRNAKKSPMRISTHIMHFRGVEADFENFKTYWQDKVDAVVLRRVGNWGGGDALGLTARLEKMGYVSAHETPQKRGPCNSIFMHFQLQPDGHYMPCIGTTPDYESNPKYSLGHASDTTWLQAWERLSAMRQAHLRGKWDEHEACRSCNIWSMWDETWFERPVADGAGTQFHIPGVEYMK